jgi:peptide/nickel transport system permease protein
MWEYLVRRIGQSLLTLFLVSIISFALIHAAPGGPIAMLERPGVSFAALQQQMHNLGLDQPVHIQYIKWLGRLLHGDFGISYQNSTPIADQLWPSLKNTLTLMSTVYALTLLIAIPWGIQTSRKPNGFLDNLASVICYAGFAMPAFWFGIILQMFFASKMHVLPLSDMHTMGKPDTVADLVKHMILPVSTLTIISLAGYLKYARNSMLEVLGQDYVRTARAKGVPERKVVFVHALRNALIPIITIIGLSLPGIFAGAALTERVFNWPGMGRLYVDFAFGREYYGLMALTMILAAVTILGNLLSDIAYAMADPRVRLTGKGVSQG